MQRRAGFAAQPPTLRVQGDHLAAELVELLGAHDVAGNDHQRREGAARAGVARNNGEAATACKAGGSKFG